MKKELSLLFFALLFFTGAILAQPDSTAITDVTNVITEVAEQLTAGTPAALITKTVCTIAGLLLTVVKPWKWFKKKPKTDKTKKY
jgi:hypothetical protein